MTQFFKIVVLGDGGIGKTSICNYLTTGEFFGSYKLSIGADFFSKKLVVDGENVTLQICDIGGQDQFANISEIFTKGAHGALLCYDTTRRDTLDSLDRWIQKLDDISIPKVLVSTKNDIEDLKEVLDEEGIATAQKFGIPYYIPTTSLKGIGITETFESISRLMLKNKKGLLTPTAAVMIDVTQPTEPVVPTISASQHISAQPLGIGRVPTGDSENDDNIQPPTAPLAPTVAPVISEVTAPVVEADQAETSFKEAITLAPPTVTKDTEADKPIVPSPQEFQGVEPPTEPEKTATQPISTITPPISEQTKTVPEEPKKDDSSFTFLDRLKKEREKVDDQEE
ncbi:MAG: GTP-binding protein [Asgard group archaeon]|nr:GTP-binding protein [Asgard group archaeon]